MHPRIAMDKPDVETLDRDAPTFVSLYSGCGGLDLGFVSAGFRPVWANEFDRHAAETYRANIGDHLVEGSISDVAWPDERAADLVIGGPPCQGFSVAGRLRADDPRSQHVFTFMDVVATVRPRAFVMENVKALAMNARWEDVRQSLFQRAIELDYTPRILVLNSADYGVAQRRERMFLIGTSGPAVEAPEPLGESPTVRDAFALLPPFGATGNDLGSTARITPARNPVLRNSGYRGSLLFNGKGRPLDLDAPAPTIPASMGGNATPIIDQSLLDGGSRDWLRNYHRRLLRGGAVVDDVPASLRRITVAEASALQSFPLDMRYAGPLAAQYRQIGNAVPPLLARQVALATLRALESAPVRELVYAGV
jgi:DNA (cytosine-5)-methyltransferase 1